MGAFVNILLVALGAVNVVCQATSNNEATKVNNLGNLSPYHQAPVPPGLTPSLPSDCQIQQVMLMGRHGSRYPLASELVFITNMTAKLAAHASAITRARLPKELQFLKNGYISNLGHDDLTAIGRRELFEHGVEFRLNYPHLKVDNVLAGDQDRVIESAQWFSQGYFGRTWNNLSSSVFSTIPEDNATVSWITPMDTCRNWQYAFGGDAVIAWGNVYLPRITERLNRLVPGLGFSNDDTHGALYACAYDYAAWKVSPWCDVFTHQELSNFEYELDLLMDGAFGFNLPNNMGPTLGSLYVSTLIERFSNSSGTAKPVYLEFGHDTTIDLALTALGLVKDNPPLRVGGPVPPTRKFRTSQQVPFAAQMIWEKFSCATDTSPQIRLLLNGAPFPLTNCATSARDRAHGTCSLAAFIRANRKSTSVKWGDAAWNATCGSASI